MICLWCGQPERVDLLEYWSSREFLLETCCEGLYEATNDWMASGAPEAHTWFRGLCSAWGIKCRGLSTDCGHITANQNLELRSIDFATACQFVNDHHRHHTAPVGWKFGHAVYNGPDLVGVSIVGRPVARWSGPPRLEVTRVCTIDSGRLAWNACSMLYGAAAREAKWRGYHAIHTYLLESEEGATMRAVGWSLRHTVKGRKWDCPTRPRSTPDLGNKVCYEKRLHTPTPIQRSIFDA